MMDKYELAGVANRLEMPTPKTASCSSAADLEHEMAGMRFPVIVKPRFAYQWRRKGVWESVGAQKAFIADTVDEVRALHQRLGDVTPGVLLQEYISGEDRDIVVCCCYVDRAGQLIGHFTARKLQQNPPLVGTGSVVEATEIERVIAPSVELLKAFDYSGLAEIEYKYDRKADAYFIIEINPRHWDQHELGNLVGVNLTWLAYADLAGFRPSRVEPRYDPALRYKWIAEPELARAVAQDIWRGLAGHGETAQSSKRSRVLGRTWSEVADLLKGKKMFALFRPRDPMPAIITFARMAAAAFRALGRLFQRKLRPESAGSGSAD